MTNLSPLDSLSHSCHTVAADTGVGPSSSHICCCRCWHAQRCPGRRFWSRGSRGWSGPDSSSSRLKEDPCKLSVLQLKGTVSTTPYTKNWSVCDCTAKQSTDQKLPKDSKYSVSLSTREFIFCFQLYGCFHWAVLPQVSVTYTRTNCLSVKHTHSIRSLFGILDFQKRKLALQFEIRTIWNATLWHHDRRRNVSAHFHTKWSKLTVTSKQNIWCFLC